MDSPPLLTPNVCSGDDETSATAQTQESVQLLVRERDSFKGERHLYQMKWLAAEDMLQAMRNEKQSLEVLV